MDAKPESPRGWSFDGVSVCVSIDLSIYSLDAVTRACYKLTDQCFVALARTADGSTVLATISGRRPESSLSELVGEFFNELLDQQIRQRLDAEFGTLRTLIVAEAFSEGNLLPVDQTQPVPPLPPE